MNLKKLSDSIADGTKTLTTEIIINHSKTLENIVSILQNLSIRIDTIEERIKNLENNQGNILTYDKYTNMWG